jgi:hypothetical protein
MHAMRSIGSALWPLGLLLLCLRTTSSSRTAYSSQSSGVFGKYVVTNFGMTVGGLIDVEYDVGPVDASLEYESYGSYVLLLVVGEKQTEDWYEKLEDDEIDMDQFCNLPSMMRRVITGQGSVTLPVTYDLGTDRYSVLILQCRTGNALNPTQVKLNVEMKNPRPYSDEYSHYPIETVMTVRLLEGEMILYALLTLGMVGQLVVSKIYARPIHWLFLVTLCSVFAYVTLRYCEGYRYNKMGEDSVPLTVAGNILGSISTTLLLASLLLVSMGWSLVRTNISKGEQQKVAMALFAFFVFSFGDAVCLDSSVSVCVCVCVCV